MFLRGALLVVRIMLILILCVNTGIASSVQQRKPVSGTRHQGGIRWSALLPGYYGGSNYELVQLPADKDTQDQKRPDVVGNTTQPNPYVLPGLVVCIGSVGGLIGYCFAQISPDYRWYHDSTVPLSGEEISKRRKRYVLTGAGIGCALGLITGLFYNYAVTSSGKSYTGPREEATGNLCIGVSASGTAWFVPQP